MKTKFTDAQLKALRKKLNAAHREADRIEGIIWKELQRVEDKLDSMSGVRGASHGTLYQTLDKYETKLQRVLGGQYW